MAGSLTYRTYRSDSGAFYSIRIDESNANASPSSGGGVLCPVRIADYPAPPRGLKPRYVNTYDQNKPVRKRRFIVGDPTLVVSVITAGATLTAGVYPNAEDDGDATTEWVVTSFRGERANVVPSFEVPDTGLIDGDSNQ